MEEAVIYIGYRNPRGIPCAVYFEAGGVRSLLPLRLDLLCGATGFEWGGVGGCGPTQLALAILAHFTTYGMAMGLYQQFRDEVVSGFAHDGWTLKASEIEEWLERVGIPF